MTTTTTTNLTPNALLLFDAYARDAGNWSGTPCVGGNVTILGDKEDRGLLTALKRAKLVTTFADDIGGTCMSTGRKLRANSWVEFTAAGRAFARSRGIDCSAWPRD